jgi:hypothetical protein
MDDGPSPRPQVGGILKAYRVGFCGAIYFCDLSSLSESFQAVDLTQI